MRKTTGRPQKNRVHRAPLRGSSLYRNADAQRTWEPAATVGSKPAECTSCEANAHVRMPSHDNEKRPTTNDTAPTAFFADLSARNALAALLLAGRLTEEHRTPSATDPFNVQRDRAMPGAAENSRPST